jgi:hypothetical protein
MNRRPDFDVPGRREPGDGSGVTHTGTGDPSESYRIAREPADISVKSQ